MKQIAILTIITFMVSCVMGQGKKSETEFYFSIKWKYADDSTLVKIPEERLYISFTDSIIVYNDSVYKIYVIFYDDPTIYSTIGKNKMGQGSSVIFTRTKTVNGRYMISINNHKTRSLDLRYYDANRINVKRFKSNKKYENWR